MIYLKHFIFVLLLGGLLSGCATPHKQTQSGFLGDYSQLQDAEKVENTRVYFSKEFSRQYLSEITEIQIAPFEVWINQPATDANIVLKSTTLARLSKYIYAQLKQKLAMHYKIVEKAGDKGINIRGAFTDIKVKNPEMSVTDFIPVRVVLNAGNSVYLDLTDQKDVVTEVSIEVEFVSGESGQRVFAMTATKELDLTVNNKDSGFEAVAQVIDIWVDNFVSKLTQTK